MGWTYAVSRTVVLHKDPDVERLKLRKVEHLLGLKESGVDKPSHVGNVDDI